MKNKYGNMYIRIIRIDFISLFQLYSSIKETRDKAKHRIKVSTVVSHVCLVKMICAREIALLF